MTVGELIEALRGFPTNLEVVIDSAEFGYQAPLLRMERIGTDPAPDVPHWRGQFLDADGSYGEVDQATVRDALVLSRFDLP